MSTKSKKLSLADRLREKLRGLGLPTRKATDLSKKLVSTASKAPVKGTVTGKLTERLVKLGLTERKAGELAKGLAPMVRSSIKAKAKQQAKTLKDVDDAMVDQTVDETVDGAEDVELDKVAPRINGHRLRTDLPVVPMPGIKGIELLRVMDGLTSTRTYLVAAVKSDTGIVAVRQLGTDLYNVKFYPTMRYWQKTPSELSHLGAVDYLEREWYHRMHFGVSGLTKLLVMLEDEAKPKSRMKALLDRFKTITAKPLIRAFDYLHGRVNKAA